MNITFQVANKDIYTFVHIPKCAGKSISAYIMQNATQFWTIHPKSHATIQDLRETKKDLGTTFAVVRNPYARVVSIYKYLFEDDIAKIIEPTIPYFHHKPDLSWHKKLRKEYPKITFSEFVNKLPYMPTAQTQNSFLPVDKILRFESLSDDFTFIQNKLNTSMPLLKINNTNTKHWKEYYTHDTADIVYEKYAKDFEVLNYSKDINN